MNDDLIKRSDAIKAVSKVDDYGDGIGFEVRSHCLVELELVPSADRPQKVIAQITFDEEKLREIVKEAVERFKEEYEITDRPQGEWIPCSERLPSEEERKEWIDKNLDGIGYLYPCLVTRYSSINPDRTKNNPYVAKHYFDGEDFVNCGEEVCSEYILAWMPLPEPWKGGRYGW